MRSPALGRQVIALGAIAASGLFLISTRHDAQGMLRSYLVAYLYWLSLPLGALPLLMTLNLTGGKWGEWTRGILEAQVRTLGGMVILFLPILAGLASLYSWADPISPRKLGPHASAYLTPGYFFVRALIYFGCWIALARGLTRVSAQSEQSDPGTRDEDRRRRVLSAGGLVAFGFTVTFAAIDWQMSLEPPWYSTIYGMLFAVGQSLQSWAAAVVVLTWAIHPSHRKPDHQTLRDIGNLLLTLLILWAYLSFMQYLIIWSGNLPDEVTWILARIQGGWKFFAIGLACFGFAAPFSALLLRSSKQRLAILRGIAVWVLLARVVEELWMVLPAFYPGHFHLRAADLAAWCAIGGFWLWLFVGRLLSGPILSPVLLAAGPEGSAHV